MTLETSQSSPADGAAAAVAPGNDAAWMAARVRSANVGAAVNTGMAYLGQALSLVTVPIYLKYLGQDQYGLMLLLVTLQTYLGQTNLGMNWAAMNLIGAARATDDEREIATVVQNALVMGAGTALVALAAAGGIAFLSQFGLAEFLQLDRGVNPWAIVAVGALSALSLAGGPVYLTFVGLGQSSWAALYQGLGRVISIPLMATAAWAGGGIAAMFAVNAAVLSVMLAVGAVHLARAFPAILRSGNLLSAAQCLRQLRMGLKNLSAELSYLLHATTPSLALGATCGAAAVPLYAVPRTLLEAALTFGRSKYSLMQPVYAEAARHGRLETMGRLLGTSVVRNAAMLGLLSAGFIVLCDPFVRLWTGGRLEVARTSAIAIALGSAALLMLQLFQLFLVAIDRQLAAVRVMLATGVACVFAAAAAGAVGGFLGVLFASAAATAATAWALGLQAAACCRSAISPRANALKFGRVVAATGATIALGLAFDRMLSSVTPPSVTLIATGAAMAACYVALLGGTAMLQQDVVSS